MCSISTIRYTAQFRDTMYDNMWQFFNTDMIETMYPSIRVSTICGVENDAYTRAHYNTLCFKEPEEEDASGHYVYVTKEGEAQSTYELNLLLRPSDDGVCHGASLIYALKGYQHPDGRMFDLVAHPDPRDVATNASNYRTILELYLHLIESGKWDRALKSNFYSEVHWISKGRTTRETQTARRTLKAYIRRFLLRA